MDPPVENIDIKCVPVGSCDIERGRAPILVEDEDKKVKFAPYDNFIEEPLTKFGPVEVGGHIFAYCKGSGKCLTVNLLLTRSNY